MSEPNYVLDHTLQCLRLAAECRNLAADVLMPDHARADYLRIANMWLELSATLPSGTEPRLA
jgi:hypothetical protein